VDFPLARPQSAAASAVRATVGSGDFALINPGAAWPNKRWPADRFGELAAFLREICGLRSVVLWGPGEQELASHVASASSGAAVVAPPTRIADVIALAREASLMVSGDTGPLHLAAAVQTPVVAIMGPTNPQRNGPWAAADVTVSRFESCGCHYERRCRQPSWCLGAVSVSEVAAAVQRRLGMRTGPDSRGSRIDDQPGIRADAPGANRT
jgi:heptosyltransferase-1